uniref:(northern house mosquito) hypothetical protein n=1 Tax=Culex pipiens TaxID=7175 RepID=A0A8D8CYT9_CULPI
MKESISYISSSRETKLSKAVVCASDGQEVAYPFVAALHCGKLCLQTCQNTVLTAVTFVFPYSTMTNFPTNTNTVKIRVLKNLQTNVPAVEYHLESNPPF